MTALAHFTPRRIAVPLLARTKDQLLAALVDLAVEADVARAGLLGEVRRRESRFTTALGDGIALPHARSPHVDDIRVAAARLEPPLAFGADDDQPVDLVFFVASPAHRPGVHLDVMRHLADRLREAWRVEALRRAASADAFLSALRATAPA